ncbi:MAG: MiaB/RimO family radical SAM methylthiotransferase, partial [Ruminococcus sp.]|nr:MiaB/RimO family radical SAM methylthiotransferase [Candidatus Apopatosoma intestinale]
LGNRNKMRAAEIAAAFLAGKTAPVRETPDVESAPLEPMSITHTENARAFVKIEDGCDNKCAYCIIKTARGNVVSRPTAEVCDEVRNLGAAGYREMVLTGIETASYGKDTGETLSGLIAAVAAVDGVERIRLGSLEPSVLTPDFVDFLASEPKFMPSLHLSLQSGSSTVLARMRRRYNAEQARARIAYLKEKMPAVTLTCDLIVGFPGETEEEFLDTCELARFAGFLHMHIFPFSAREGTEAAAMDGQIAKEVKIERAARLSRIGDELANRVYESHAHYAGRVLWETYENGVNHGHTETMLEASMPGEDLRGQTVRVRCVSIENRTLLCERE